MESTVTIAISVVLPVSKVEQLLKYLETLDTPETSSDDADAAPASVQGPQDLVEMLASQNKLGYLLDEQLQLRKLVSFISEKNGTLYNPDLAEELGIRTPLTSIYLGQITKKLRFVGVDAEKWYTKHRTSRGTLIRVRPDVLELFRDAVEQWQASG